MQRNRIENKRTSLRLEQTLLIESVKMRDSVFGLVPLVSFKDKVLRKRFDSVFLDWMISRKDEGFVEKSKFGFFFFANINKD